MRYLQWVITFFLTYAACGYGNVQSQKTELYQLNKNIVSLQTDLKKFNLKKSALSNVLEKTETEQSQITQALNKTQIQLHQQEKKLHLLKQKSHSLTIAQNQYRQSFRKQLVWTYIFSQSPYLKLLLSPNDVTKTQRILTYYHYIAEKQLQTMTHLQQSLSVYEQNQKAIQHQRQTLLTLKKSELLNQQALKKIKAQRQALIQAIDQHIQTKHQKLTQLLKNKKQLTETIAQLNTESLHFTYPHGPFSKLQGKLSWPAKGLVQHNFGTPVYQSQLKWDGVLIDATLGQSVHAVAAGRVVFAKWMAGYGLLLIINHGNGYMTLYGRNQTIIKQVGDWVKPGEVIATVGRSGGFEHAALYFSIRHDARALNPAKWCA